MILPSTAVPKPTHPSHAHVAVSSDADCSPRLQANTVASVCKASNGFDGTSCPLVMAGSGACGEVNLCVC
jgi:hypothetical protein